MTAALMNSEIITVMNAQMKNFKADMWSNDWHKNIPKNIDFWCFRQLVSTFELVGDLLPSGWKNMQSH